MPEDALAAEAQRVAAVRRVIEAPIAERGSMAATTMRLLRIESLVTWAARAKAASTASLSP